MAAIVNGYSTLAAVKAILEVTSTNSADDGVLNDLITQTSRYIDNHTGRHFHPTIETRLYDVPEGRELWLDDDLLAATTVTNGDLVAVTEYNLLPPNYYPKYAVRLKDWSSVYWTTDSNSGSEQVISVLGVWGFHQKYALRGWLLGSTLNENPLNATDLTFTAISGTLFSPGQIIKIENEIMNVTTVATNDLTVIKRGDNGSTAATHVLTTPIYIWQPEPDIELACRMIVKNLYHNRFGQNATGAATITGAGVVISPEDIPASALAILKNYERLC
jgi:hypothetical protein